MKRISYLLLFLLLHILLLTGCQGINNETNSIDSWNEKLDEYANVVDIVKIQKGFKDWQMIFIIFYIQKELKKKGLQGNVWKLFYSL